MDIAEDPLGGVPGGGSPSISVAIEGSTTCAPGAGGVADAAVGVCAANTTSGVVAEALFVIICAAPLRTAVGNEVAIASGDVTTLEEPVVAGPAARVAAGRTGFIDTGAFRPGVL